MFEHFQNSWRLHFLESSAMAVSNQTKKNSSTSRVFFPAEMLERCADVSRSSQSPASSNYRKRSVSVGDEQKGKSRRVSLDVSTWSLPSSPSETVSDRVMKTPSGSAHGGVRSCVYPESLNVSYEPSPVLENSGFSCYESSLTGLGCPGQYDVLVQNSVETNSPVPLLAPLPTKQNRFNLSRYQLDDDEDLFATISEPAAAQDEAKPNKFKTQRERLMVAMSPESEESDSTAPDCDVTNLPHGGDESSQDSYMSQRERLRRFSNEQCRNVVIPNQWEGETKLQEFVAFGNIEAALRPLGLMMARAALVSDSVNTRHHRPTS